MLPFFIIVLILSLSVVAQVKYGTKVPSSTSRIGKHAMESSRRKA